MSRCTPGTCRADINAMVARRLASQAVECAIKAALAEVAAGLEIAVRTGDGRTVMLDAVAEGLLAAQPFLDSIHKE